jgi:ribose 5-phosphate isomerase A
MGGQNESKRRAAEEAVGYVQSGMVLGLGTGSTAALAVEAVGRKLAEGELVDIAGIPTSTRTRDQANALGIPLTTLEEHPRVDLTIDGADEVDAQGDLIKGGGGALLWEKIVAAATKLYIIVVDESKLVERLGARFAVPIEVMPFGWGTHLEPMRAMDDPNSVDRTLRNRPGVVETGLFLGMEPRVIVGRAL